MDGFSKLLAAEIPQLRRYAQALTRDATRAEDLTQTCLLRALVKQDLWQAGTNLRSWLMTMMHNQHVSDIRRSARENTGIAAWAHIVPDSCSPHTDESLLLAEVRTAIGRLPECQQPVVALACLEGLDYRHVAARLGIPEGTVRSRLSRARANLRSLFDEHDKSDAEPPRIRAADRRRAGTPTVSASIIKAPQPMPGFPRGFAAHPPARTTLPHHKRSAVSTLAVS